MAKSKTITMTTEDWTKFATNWQKSKYFNDVMDIYRKIPAYKELDEKQLSTRLRSYEQRLKAEGYKIPKRTKKRDKVELDKVAIKKIFAAK